MLTPQDLGLDGSSQVAGTGLYSKASPRPGLYRSFAERDLAEPDEPRTRVNALSNAKRALHLQVELLTHALGFERAPNTRDRFPSRLEFLEKCGMIAPRIISKISLLRNEVEHEYVVPERAVVEDYVDVVGLYLEASDKFVSSFPTMREVHKGSWRDGNVYCITTDIGSGVISVFAGTLGAVLGSRPDPKSQDSVGSPQQTLPTSPPALLAVDVRTDAAMFFDWATVLLGTAKRP